MRRTWNSVSMSQLNSATERLRLDMNLDIEGVDYLSDFRLVLTFANRERREVDMVELVQFDGIFSELRDVEYFRRVRVNPEIGTIVWPNGADLCPDVLYERSRPLACAAAPRQ